MKDFETGLTADRLREVLRYSPSTGEFHWRIMCSARRPAGMLAGDKKIDSGYILIGVDGFRYRAHRLAWLYMTGAWPTDQIDHEDTNRSNNRWDNLRTATNQLNQANARLSKNNTSGFKGVFWNHRLRKWQAKISVDGQQIHLGYHEDAAVLAAAYLAAAKKYFGDFARAA